MPTELAFQADTMIQPGDPVSLGRALVRPYERIRLLALCPYDAQADVEVVLTHVVGEGGAGPLDRIVLVPGSLLNRVYDVPGEVLAVTATSMADAPTGAIVYLWGFRSGEGSPPAPPRPAPVTALRISAVLGDGAGTVLEPLGAGVLVAVDGGPIEMTDDSGEVTVPVEPGTHQIKADLPSMLVGITAAEAVAGSTTKVTIALVESADRTEPVDLNVAELVNGALPLDAATITIGFARPDGSPVHIETAVQVEASAAGTVEDLTDYFTVDGGTLIATGASATNVVAVIAGLTSDARLYARAMDADGHVYEDDVVVGAGVYRVEGLLVAPASAIDLPLTGLTISSESANGTQNQVESAADGTFLLADRPGGMIAVRVATEHDGRVFTAEALFPVDGDKQLTVRPLTTADVQAGVAEFEVVSLAPPPLSRSAARSEPDTPAPITALSADASVSVTAVGEGQRVTAVETVTVPQGTGTVLLDYAVSTAEYPKWVLEQSRFNDTWDVLLLADGGTVLFRLGRWVNSQLWTAPTWNATGGTGTYQEEIDVSALTADADAGLTLRASATNIGDDLLPTQLVAAIAAVRRFAIESVDWPDPDRFVSIPRPGVNNTFPRRLSVQYAKPEDYQLTGLTVELLDSTGTALQTIFDGGLDSPRVTLVGDDRLEVFVTFDPGAPACEVESTPPPSDTVGYRVVLRGTDENGAAKETDPKDHTGLVALWRMPDNMPRYSRRELGGDDWSRRFTYEWLDAHRLTITAVNDISGEHGGYFNPHTSHRQGYDMDVFHPLPLLPPGSSGGQNYFALAALSRRTLAGDQVALGQLKGWVAYTRQWLDAMIADPDVLKMWYLHGFGDTFSGVTELRAGWGEELLTSGGYAGPGGHTIDLGLGWWPNRTSTKIGFDNGHNDHVHVRLRPAP
ncbi:hypothetical protein [Phytohabitans aurantiacus]|uniref:Carboxypeptidase regulatory-like domain-containing protein n=1 Tax=Phytohabitans aurantiacus TaxID=3016789 RepID=A0ABQ5QWP0_9ACTN|nr:hypothetical protein [Phytohabitans aurantiacus]GLH98859.1 hypothetical protein Pa4123_41340 [Phytohabitans aurantiacus]